MVPGLRTASTFFSSARLISRFSTTASMIQSQSASVLRVVFEIADGHQSRKAKLEKRGRLRLLRCLESGSAAIRLRSWHPSDSGGHDVEQEVEDTSVREVSGDARAHGSRAQYCNLLYSVSDMIRDFLAPVCHFMN